MGEAQTRPGSEHPREALDPRGECLELSQLECEHSLSRANTLKQELRGQTLRNFGSASSNCSDEWGCPCHHMGSLLKQ